MQVQMTINRCPRCKEKHEEIYFSGMKGQPVILEYTWIATCPKYNEPIFLKIGDWKHPVETSLLA
jgi:hypothetical protein